MEGGQLSGHAEPIASGRLDRKLLRSGGVFLLDTGFHVYLWVGRSADFQLRVSAFPFAQSYLKQFARPAVLPLTRFGEGQESLGFWGHFQPEGMGRGYRIDATPQPERFHPMMRAVPAANARQRSKPKSKSAKTAPAPAASGEGEGDGDGATVPTSLALKTDDGKQG